jgi:hypothetical protein
MAAYGAYNPSQKWFANWRASPQEKEAARIDALRLRDESAAASVRRGQVTLQPFSEAEELRAKLAAIDAARPYEELSALGKFGRGVRATGSALGGFAVGVGRRGRGFTRGVRDTAQGVILGDSREDAVDAARIQGMADKQAKYRALMTAQEARCCQICEVQKEDEKLAEIVRVREAAAKTNTNNIKRVYNARTKRLPRCRCITSGGVRCSRSAASGLRGKCTQHYNSGSPKVF